MCRIMENIYSGGVKSKFHSILKEKMEKEYYLGWGEAA